MHHRSPYPTAKPQPSWHPDFPLLMHRLDEHSVHIHELRGDVRELKTSIDAVRIESRDQVDALRKDSQQQLETFRKDSQQQLETFRKESQQQLDTFRKDSQQQLDTFRRESQQQLDAFRRETQQHLQEMRAEIASTVHSCVSAAVAPLCERFNTLNERVNNAGLASDARLLKWFAGSAASSSGLAIIVSRMLS
ncbi:FoF1-type ATP synthase, membrane subunit b or b' [Mitsuaria sp. PDC51]|nr:FoF1-type ATP synthase, membrane subunit b or b' [Mitsuaria sp. PDC51]